MFRGMNNEDPTEVNFLFEYWSVTVLSNESELSRPAYYPSRSCDEQHTARGSGPSQPFVGKESRLFARAVFLMSLLETNPDSSMNLVHGHTPTVVG
jgi:hypothetical protein